MSQLVTHDLHHRLCGSLKSKLNLLFKEKMKLKPYKRIFCPRYITCLIHKLRMNSWKTKYSKDITCVCKEPLSIHHILMECHYFKDKGINNTSTSMNEILLDDIKLLECQNYCQNRSWKFTLNCYIWTTPMQQSQRKKCKINSLVVA